MTPVPQVAFAARRSDSRDRRGHQRSPSRSAGCRRTSRPRRRNLAAFANTNANPFIHPVIKAIALHFAIGFVHPFVDGNGRTARAIFYWYMLKEGYAAFEYLPISRILIRAPMNYARAYLYTETDDGDLTYFNHYQLQAILRAISSLHEYFERKEPCSERQAN